MTMSDPQFEHWHPRQLSVAVPASAPSIEQIRETARQEGYTAGYSEGQSKGLEDAKAHTKVLNDQFADLLSSLEQPFARQEVDVSEYLLGLLSAMCMRILRRELIGDEDFIRGCLERAMDTIASQDSVIRVTVHPEDKAVVEELWDPQLASLALYEDSTIIRGGCCVERGDSLVDSTIENQLRQILEQLADSEESQLEAGSKSDRLDVDKVLDTAERLDGPPNGD